MSDTLRPQKRSFTIRGHRTSLSLETPFWNALQRAAREDGIPVAALVTKIDTNRGLIGLSSAIRVYLFERYCAIAFPHESENPTKNEAANDDEASLKKSST